MVEFWMSYHKHGILLYPENQQYLIVKNGSCTIVQLKDKRGRGFLFTFCTDFRIFEFSPFSYLSCFWPICRTPVFPLCPFSCLVNLQSVQFLQQIVLFPYSLILTLCVLFICIWKSHLVLYGKLGVWHNCHQITYSADANTWQCNPLEIIKNNLPVPYGRVLQKCVWNSYMF